MQQERLPGRRKAVLWAVLAGVAALVVVILLVRSLLKEWSAEAPRAVDEASVSADAVADATAEVPPSDAAVDKRQRAWRGRRITPRELRSLQRRNRSMINFCYERVARRAPSLVRKKTLVSVHLKSGGRVGRVDVRAGGDSQLEGCLRRVIRAWRFPRALRAQQVDFSVVFAR
jgi:hypothetical protein